MATDATIAAGTAAWARLTEHGLGISVQERYRNLPVISTWRDGLDEAQRGRLNHPGAVWHAWRRATTSAATQPRQRVVTKKATTTRGYGRAVHWPSDALRRAAAAIRETRSNDCITQAKAALEAAIRNEVDLLALLPPMPSANSAPQRAVAMSALPRGADIGGAAGHVR